jgi:NAD(P)-dependent dehydrogenase (short-subunit alcohol dehydrogenase family)
MPFDLSGQTAIVTGGATGIGEAISKRLADAGATIAVADLNKEGAAQVAASLPNNSFGVEVDVSSSSSVKAAVDAVLAKTGRVHILVNNAGVAGKAAPIQEQTDEDFERVIQINVNGVFFCCRAVIPHMLQHKYGRIVNIASIAGKEGNPNMIAYSGSKSAVIGMTKSLGKEVATQGICVNAVAPAVVRTKILEQLTDAQISYMTEKIPMRRTGEPWEIAAVVHFLSSPDCSFVTAQCYDASGGRATY